MKKTLFGGMKIKGSTAKPQESKDKVAASQTNFKNESYVEPIQQKVQSHKSSVQDSSKAYSETKPQLKQGKPSIQQPLKEETPKLQKEQSFTKQLSKSIDLSQGENIASKNKAQSIRQSAKLDREDNYSQNNRNDRKDQKKKIGENVVARKDAKKSLSERDYDDEDNEEREDVREDRSVVVGNYRVDEEKEDIEFKKTPKSKITSTVPKSNPLLNQLKKISKAKQPTNKQQQSSQQTKLKPVGPPSKQQKPKREKSTIMEELWASHGRMLEAIMRKKQAKEQIINLTGHVMQLKEELSVMVNKQNHYITAEEYQLADKMQSRIQEITSKVQQQEMQISFSQQSLFKLQHQSLSLLRGHLQQQKRTVRRIKLVQLDIEDEISNYKRQQEQKIESSRILNQNEKKKFIRIVNDIKNQSQQLLSYQKTFYQDLNGRKQPLETVLNEEEARRNQLEKEIKQLEEKLKKKKALLKSTLSSIEATKQKVLEVDRAFEQERENLDQRKQRIKQLESEKTLQNKKLTEMEQKLKTLEKLKDQQINTMTREKQSYQRLSSNLQQFFQSTEVEEYLTQKKRAIEEFISHSKSLKAFEQKHKQKKDKIKQLQFQKSNILSEITKNQERVKQLKTLIPKLQSEQKQFSLAKNFKGAGMKKNQIKECNDQIINIKKTIEQGYATQAQIDSQVEEINSEQEKYLEEENQLRKELALSQYRLALDKRRDVRKELQWLQELQKGDKMRVSYESKLLEELQGLDEEINYIAQEYQLQQEVQGQAINSHKKQIKQLRQEQLKISSIDSGSTPLQSITNGTDQSQGSYIPLTLNDNQEQEVEHKTPSSKSHLESSGKQQSDSISNPPQNQQEPQEQTTKQQEQSSYQPLQLDDNNHEEPQHQEQEQEGNDIDEQHKSVEDDQEHDQAEERKESQVQEHQHDQQEQQDDANTGYVPLQLD